MIELYADENEPKVNFTERVYRVSFPRPTEVKSSDAYALYVGVDNYGMIAIHPHSYWFGMNVDQLKFEERQEIYEFLIEWELAVWRKIGPEDSELFATTKLDKEFGLDL